jgi:3',5'-cyclic AMP phosphodiesterase CpdA
MLIAQLSDVHVGGGRYREELLRAAIEEINTAAPDLVVVAGDLTDEGYPDQYPLEPDESIAAPKGHGPPGLCGIYPANRPSSRDRRKGP